MGHEDTPEARRPLLGVCGLAASPPESRRSAYGRVALLERPDLPLNVVRHGMNGHELAANPRLGRRFVQDLNLEPVLAEPDGTFDAVLICVRIL